ncbi:MAG TPA: hypothetical protein VEY12_11820 [Thermoplasmata archaeon]|nr:hypothetical protein [Thermoplasmata archaeon]
MVDLNAFVGLFSVFEDHALIFGAVFLVAGVFLGILNRAAAFLVLGLALFSSGSVILGELAKQQSMTATLIGVALGIASATALYRSARLILIALEFGTFFVAWFLLLYSFLGIGFTSNVVDVILWLVAGGFSVFLTQRATAVMATLHPLLRTHATWKAPAALVSTIPVPKR